MDVIYYHLRHVQLFLAALPLPPLFPLFPARFIGESTTRTRGQYTYLEQIASASFSLAWRGRGFGGNVESLSMLDWLVGPGGCERLVLVCFNPGQPPRANIHKNNLVLAAQRQKRSNLREEMPRCSDAIFIFISSRVQVTASCFSDIGISSHAQTGASLLGILTIIEGKR